VPCAEGPGKELALLEKLLFCLAGRVGGAGLGKVRREQHVIFKPGLKVEKSNTKKLQSPSANLKAGLEQSVLVKLLVLLPFNIQFVYIASIMNIFHSHCMCCNIL
jgi:hypothetical protein